MFRHHSPTNSSISSIALVCSDQRKQSTSYFFCSLFFFLNLPMLPVETCLDTHSLAVKSGGFHVATPSAAATVSFTTSRTEREGTWASFEGSFCSHGRCLRPIRSDSTLTTEIIKGYSFRQIINKRIYLFAGCVFVESYIIDLHHLLCQRSEEAPFITCCSSLVSPHWICQCRLLFDSHLPFLFLFWVLICAIFELRPCSKRFDLCWF